MALEICYSGQMVEAVQAHGTVTVRAPSNTIGVSTGILGGGCMPYQGPYEVTPGREAQVLPTEARTLAWWLARSRRITDSSHITARPSRSVRSSHNGAECRN